MKMTLTYWRDSMSGPRDRTETVEQHFRGLDPEITPEFQDQTLKLSIAVVDGPEDLEEWVSLYLDFGSIEEFDKWAVS